LLFGFLLAIWWLCGLAISSLMLRFHNFSAFRVLFLTSRCQTISRAFPRNITFVIWYSLAGSSNIGTQRISGESTEHGHYAGHFSRIRANIMRYLWFPIPSSSPPRNQECHACRLYQAKENRWH
jgi:hypothetical protein